MEIREMRTICFITDYESVLLLHQQTGEIRLPTTPIRSGEDIIRSAYHVARPLYRYHNLFRVASFGLMYVVEQLGPNRLPSVAFICCFYVSRLPPRESSRTNYVWHPIIDGIRLLEEITDLAAPLRGFDDDAGWISVGISGMPTRIDKRDSAIPTGFRVRSIITDTRGKPVLLRSQDKESWITNGRTPLPNESLGTCAVNELIDESVPMAEFNRLVSVSNSYDVWSDTVTFDFVFRATITQDAQVLHAPVSHEAVEQVVFSIGEDMAKLIPKHSSILTLLGNQRLDIPSRYVTVYEDTT